MAAADTVPEVEDDCGRLAGQTRFGTAGAIADAYESASDTDTAIIANGFNFPDALAASGLASELNAPVLLTNQDSLPLETASALDDIGVTNVVIVGGTAAVGQAVENALDADYNVDRVAGLNRYETARDIALEIDTVGQLDGRNTAIIATGNNYPDALAGGPIAYNGDGTNPFPILLTDRGTVPAATQQALDAHDIEQVIVLGGTDAVPTTAVAQLGQLTGRAPIVLAGTTREGTAQAVADFAVDRLGFDTDAVLLADGRLRFPSPDALSGGPLGGLVQAPILLVNPGMPAQTEAFITENQDSITQVIALGGTLAVPTEVLEAGCEAAGIDTDQPPAGVGVTDRPELINAQIVSTRTTTQTQPGAFGGPGTVVRYTFDEPVTGAAPNPALFKVYAFDGTPFTGTGMEIAVDPADNRSVLVRFSMFDNATADRQVSRLSVATVEFGAVRDGTGLENPIGDAAIGTGSTTQLQAGVTAAPDLVSVGNFQQAATAGQTTVDFTFDQAAFVQNTTGFSLVRTNNTVVECVSSTNTATPNTGTVAGGSGTTMIRVACPGEPAIYTDANFARGVVQQGTVRAGATSGATNPLQAADIGSTVGTVGPDLDSVIFLPDAQPGVDTVAFVFDQPVTNFVGVSPTPSAGFGVYTGAGGNAIQSAAAQRSPENDRIVAVFFPDGTLTNAVGANVIDSTVQGTGGTINRDDEVGATPTSPTQVTPGRTAGPDLIAVASQGFTDGFGTASSRVTYTFDSRITDASALRTGATADPSAFYAYTPDGIRLQCARFEPLVQDDRTNNQTVVCDQFVLAGTTTPATNAQVQAAVLGTVEAGAVRDTTTAARTNPEGAERITR